MMSRRFSLPITARKAAALSALAVSFFVTIDFPMFMLFRGHGGDGFRIPEHWWACSDTESEPALLLCSTKSHRNPVATTSGYWPRTACATLVRDASWRRLGIIPRSEERRVGKEW